MLPRFLKNSLRSFKLLSDHTSKILLPITTWTSYVYCCGNSTIAITCVVGQDRVESKGGLSLLLNTRHCYENDFLAISSKLVRGESSLRSIASASLVQTYAKQIAKRQAPSAKLSGITAGGRWRSCCVRLRGELKHRQAWRAFRYESRCQLSLAISGLLGGYVCQNHDLG